MRWSPQLTLVLNALRHDREEWRHGYSISKETGIASGTLYPLLARLEDAGWIRARWEDSVRGRPPRRAYKLTAKGRGEAETLLAARLEWALP